MTTYSTLDSAKSNNSSVKIFDSYFNYSANVEADRYDVVYSYFYSMSKDYATASNFATMLFRVASVSGTNIMDLIESIKSTDGIKTTALLAYYLNSIRSKTIMYGVNATPFSNQNVQRNVVT